MRTLLHLSFLGLLCLAGCSSPTSSPSPGPLVVQTDKGAVRGAALDGARAFLGIPYAAAPVGDQRWKPPAEAPAWNAPRDAVQRGPRCTQINPLDGKPIDGTLEDCLTVNVWTPLAATTKAKVFVWIHGGAFITGSGGDPQYDGALLAQTEGAAVVTMNYRLGPLGFLSHKGLAAEEGRGRTPSFGLLDQQAALKWVKRNIQAFGGDPDNVTLFGESAGAMSACAQLVMPGSRGLFHRVIMESGNCSGALFVAAADAEALGDKLGAALGCTGATAALACMRAKSTTEIFLALPARTSFIGDAGVLWVPSVDGLELPKPPIDALEAGEFAKVPFLAGTNANEGALFLSSVAFFRELTDDDVTKTVTWLFGAQNVATVVGAYPATSPSSKKAALIDIITDGLFLCPTRRAARAVARASLPVYLYQFKYALNVALLPGVGAAHGFELPFVWGNPFFGATKLNDREILLSNAVMNYWARFASSGNPNGGTEPLWPVYAASTDENLVLDQPIATSSGLKKERCDFWDGVR